LDEADRQAVVERYFSFGPDEMDLAHEMYHEDAVLEFPQSGERFEGVQNSRNGVSNIRPRLITGCAGSLPPVTR
jgi:hypothetical protein